jgi:Tol biopolymer transport system component
VVALVGANSPADESSPKLSSDRQWLAFQRTTTDPDDADVMLFNTRTQRLHRLPNLNSAAFDETSPDLTGDGRWIAYVFEDGAAREVRVYDVSTAANYALPGLHRAFAEVDDPRFSRDNRRLLFSAATRRADGGASTSDLYLYDLATATLFEVPFVNTPFNETDPDLHQDDRRLLFTSDRRGTRDVFEVDLRTGTIDELPFANTERFDESSPRYYGQDSQFIRYRLFPSPVEAPDAYQLRIYDPKTARVDTVPVGNRLLVFPF